MVISNIPHSKSPTFSAIHKQKVRNLTSQCGSKVELLILTFLITNSTFYPKKKIYRQSMVKKITDAQDKKIYMIDIHKAFMPII